MNDQPIMIPLSQIYANKVQVIQEAISEPTTHRQIVEGLIDTGYANALKTLKQTGRISDTAFTQGLKSLPEHLRACFDS
jgi:hypothetical protein